MLERFYEEELRYLYEAGREFARAHPELARFLNIDAVGDRDPTVERLFEGFAFLTARIREQLEDSFPELCESLVNQLWPHLLRDMPSAAILELRPRRGLLQQTRVIEPGAEVLSAPVGAEATVCRFTTTQPVRLNPVSLVAVDRRQPQPDSEQLSLTFRVDSAVNWSAVTLTPLRLFCHGEFADALRLYTHLTSHVAAVWVEADDGALSFSLDPASAVTAAGLSSGESLLPPDPRTLWIHTLLLEYFSYPEKFLFVDLAGLDRLTRLEHPPQRFTCTLTFNRPLPLRGTLTPDHLRLHCTPVVNLFVRDAEPVTVDGRRNEYRVIPDAARRASVVPHSVVSVTGIDRATGRRRSYRPLSLLDMCTASPTACYEPHYRRAPDGTPALYLLVGGPRLDGDEIREENLSITVRCTNGILPREELRESSLNRSGPGIPDMVTITNITRPSLPLRPPSTDTRWTFVSQLCASCGTLARVESLRTLLRSYEWSGDERRRKQIDAIVDAALVPQHHLSGGAVIRGSMFVLTVDETRYGDTTDLSLFGRVMATFLSHYVALNERVWLEIVLRPSGRTLTFGYEEGRRWPV